MKKLSNFEIIKLTVTSILGMGVLISNEDFIKMKLPALGIFAIWLLSGIVAWFQSLCYAELAEIDFLGGGDASYLSRGFCSGLGASYNIISCLIILPCSISTFLRELFTAFNLNNKILRISFIIAVVSVIYIPRKLWHNMATVFFYMKISSLIFLAVVLIFCRNNNDSYIVKNFTGNITIMSFISGMLKCTYYFSGFNSCNFLTRDSVPNLKFPYSISLIITTCIYLYFSWLTLSIFSPATESLIVLASNKILKGVLAKILSRFIGFSLFFTPIVGTHILFDGIITSTIEKFEVVDGFKYIALFVYSLMTILFTVFASLETIETYTSGIMSIFYMLTFVAHLKLRSKWYNKDKLNTFIPIIAIITSSLFIIQFIYEIGSKLLKF